MIVVSNTSPIMNLSIAGHHDLLRQMYEKVLIPEAVRDELSVSGSEQSWGTELQKTTWLEIRSVSNRALVNSLLSEVDSGEAEAIALAAEVEADLLLMDERRGRKLAARLGVKTIGLLGALIEAKRKGLVTEVKPVLDQMIAKAGFWVSRQLYSRVMQEAGE